MCDLRPSALSVRSQLNLKLETIQFRPLGNALVVEPAVQMHAQVADLVVSHGFELLLATDHGDQFPNDLLDGGDLSEVGDHHAESSLVWNLPEGVGVLTPHERFDDKALRRLHAT